MSAPDRAADLAMLVRATLVDQRDAWPATDRLKRAILAIRDFYSEAAVASPPVVAESGAAEASQLIQEAVRAVVQRLESFPLPVLARGDIAATYRLLDLTGNLTGDVGEAFLKVARRARVGRPNGPVAGLRDPQMTVAGVVAALAAPACADVEAARLYQQLSNLVTHAAARDDSKYLLTLDRELAAALRNLRGKPAATGREGAVLRAGQGDLAFALDRLAESSSGVGLRIRPIGWVVGSVGEAEFDSADVGFTAHVRGAGEFDPPDSNSDAPGGGRVEFDLNGTTPKFPPRTGDLVRLARSPDSTARVLVGPSEVDHPHVRGIRGDPRRVDMVRAAAPDAPGPTL